MARIMASGCPAAGRRLRFVAVLFLGTLLLAGVTGVTSATADPSPPTHAVYAYDSSASVAQETSRSLRPAAVLTGSVRGGSRIAERVSGRPRGFVVAAKAGGAYGTALSGGRHAGFLANYAGKPTAQIERGITSIEKQIAEHQAKIATCERYIDDWASLDPRQQQALVNSKWPGDIARQQEQFDILRGILGSR
jgi:hypothetical protein